VFFQRQGEENLNPIEIGGKSIDFEISNGFCTIIAEDEEKKGKKGVQIYDYLGNGKLHRCGLVFLIDNKKVQKFFIDFNLNGISAKGTVDLKTGIAKGTFNGTEINEPIKGNNGIDSDFAKKFSYPLTETSNYKVLYTPNGTFLVKKANSKDYLKTVNFKDVSKIVEIAPNEYFCLGSIYNDKDRSHKLVTKIVKNGKEFQVKFHDYPKKGGDPKYDWDKHCHKDENNVNLFFSNQYTGIWKYDFKSQSLMLVFDSKKDSCHYYLNNRKNIVYKGKMIQIGNDVKYFISELDFNSEKLIRQFEFDDYTRFIYYDQDGNYWSNVRSELVKFNHVENSIKSFESVYDLKADTIQLREHWCFRDIIEDSRGGTWIVGYEKLYFFDKENNRLILYSNNLFKNGISASAAVNFDSVHFP
jgi:hypothetical protein